MYMFNRHHLCSRTRRRALCGERAPQKSGAMLLAPDSHRHMREEHAPHPEGRALDSISDQEINRKSKQGRKFMLKDKFSANKKIGASKKFHEA
jgi:hypothetical protein